MTPREAVEAQLAILQPQIDVITSQITALVKNPGPNKAAARLEGARLFQELVTVMLGAMRADYAFLKEGADPHYDMSRDVNYFSYLKSLDDFFEAISITIKTQLLLVGFQSKAELYASVTAESLIKKTKSDKFVMPGPSTPQ